MNVDDPFATDDLPESEQNVDQADLHRWEDDGGLVPNPDLSWWRNPAAGSPQTRPDEPRGLNGMEDS